MSRFQHRRVQGSIFSHVIIDTATGKEVAWSTSLKRAELGVRLRNEDDDQLPEKTLDQLLSERPDLRAYRDEVRARLWDVETLADPLRRVA